MTETNPAQSRLSTPFTTSLGFGGQYFLSEAPQDQNHRINKHELVVAMGFRRDVKRAENIKAKFQLEYRFANFNLEIPGLFEKPNSLAFSQALLFRFSMPKKPAETEEKNASTSALAKKRIPERWGLVPSLQLGAVRRNFNVATQVPAPEAGLDPEGPLPTPQECENAAMDNPFGGSDEQCDPMQSPTVTEIRPRELWGADLIVGLAAGFKVLPQRAGKDLLNLSAEARLRAQLAPDALPRLSARFLVGASTVFHPKLAKFINMSLRVGPEWNLMNGEQAIYLYLNFQPNFDTKPGGF